MPLFHLTLCEYFKVYDVTLYCLLINLDPFKPILLKRCNLADKSFLWLVQTWHKNYCCLYFIVDKIQDYCCQPSVSCPVPKRTVFTLGKVLAYQVPVTDTSTVSIKTFSKMTFSIIKQNVGECCRAEMFFSVVTTLC
jgi:hypothetical protein